MEYTDFIPKQSHERRIDMGKSAKQKPMTLKELIEKGDHAGFRLMVGYYVELTHGLMGFFPAIESQSEKMVVTVDPELLKRVWKTLTPRRSKASTQLTYANAETGVAYFIPEKYQQLEESKPFGILTYGRFDELMAGPKPAFKWAPGLIGPGMSKKEFEETLQAALAEAAK
jgi:hypothetical protein